MKTKYKKVMFELEVSDEFNLYSFFRLFKRIKAKGFFPHVLGVSKLHVNGQVEKLKDLNNNVEKENDFILSTKYGVK